IDELPEGVRPADIESLRRELHTLKGNSGMMGLEELQGLAHTMEDRVDELDSAAPDLSALFAGLDRFKDLLLEAERSHGSRTSTTPTDDANRKPRLRRDSSIRVPLAKLDDLVDLSTELLVARTRLEVSIAEGLATATEVGDSSAPLWKRLSRSRIALEKTLEALQRKIQELRLVPLRPVIAALKRVVHDESQRAVKEVRLHTTGEDTPLDNSLLEFAGETLGHLVRNAVVHGIEAPSKRQELGKPPTGRIALRASIRAGSVVIEVLDDGGGIDRAALEAAAREAGFDVGPETDLHDLVFQSGLSSRRETDRSAGRGIGMSAVVEAARRYGGLIEVETATGEGTRFKLQLPLTVAAAEALLVEVRGEQYAIPAGAILETAAVTDSDTNLGALVLGDFDVPLIDLGVHLGSPEGAAEKEGMGHDASERYAVVLAAAGRTRALLVDQVLDLREIVVHRLDESLQALPGLGGTTVLGDGRVVLILDPEALAIMPTVVEALGTAP
ncbi:MAG: chemotaxis protein CheW, partial [Acidobacteriota bacterium]|nr:chemotaxis protein CheW [Acidobacteriota bacterium]